MSEQVLNPEPDAQRMADTPRVIIVGQLSDEARAEVVRVVRRYDASWMEAAAYADSGPDMQGFESLLTELDDFDPLADRRITIGSLGHASVGHSARLGTLRPLESPALQEGL